MSKCCPISWALAVLVVALMVGLGHCVPVEVVYTGEACDSPKRLDYQINVPRMEKPKKYTPSEYGYKVDVPVPTKAKVSYSFDFVVEEPRTPRPEKPTKWNLYAKVDRIAVNRGDCEEHSAPNPPPAPCSCRQCGVTKPPFRYVYKRVQPCRCQRLGCRCNAARRASANAIPTYAHPLDAQPGRRSCRRKRDLHRAFFRNRKPSNARPIRYTKLYHKSLPSKRHALLPLVGLPSLRAKIVKRDIKGEYDLLEQERDQMDLTLPEIIQFMPETLRPDFKRGPCAIGCFCQRRPQGFVESEDRKDDTSEKPETSAEHKPGDDDDETEAEDSAKKEFQEEGLFYIREGPPKNAIGSSTYAKRNAAHYDQGLAEPYGPPQMPSFFAQPSLPRPTDPVCASQQTSYSAPAPEYVYDRLGHKYEENNGRLRLLGAAAAASVPDTTDSVATPLQYAGDLEDPAEKGRDAPAAADPMLGASRYPVLPISNAGLDKAISDIVYSHPEFIDATSHYGGGLVDPKPMQEHQTKDFLKKLIEGRLNFWFGDSDTSDYHHNPGYESGGGSYGSSYQPYQPMQGYLPSRNQS